MNSTYDYPLSNDYMWYKMILESFKSQTSKDVCLGYFMHQYQIRSDVFVEQSYFFKTCKEHTISLNKAFKAVLENNYKPPILDPIVDQILKCDHVYSHTKNDELAIFGEKTLMIGVKDFENIIKGLDELILSNNNVNRLKTKYGNREIPKSRNLKIS